MDNLNDTSPPSLPESETSEEFPRSMAQPEVVVPQVITDKGSEFWPLFLFLAFLLGLGSGYLLWGRIPNSGDNPSVTIANPVSTPTPFVTQVTLPDSYTLPVSFGDIGPRLVAAGAIDYGRFVQLYAEAGQPLTEEQLEILTKGSDAPSSLTGITPTSCSTFSGPSA